MLKKVVVLLLYASFVILPGAIFPAVPLGCASGVPLGDVDLRVRRNPKLPALTGRDLEVIAKVGWGPDAGIPVAGLPMPVGGDRRKQSLQIALPWPPPSPRAALWIWF